MDFINISQDISLRQSLSRKMIQSVNILQMNAQELSEYISVMSLENPLVELPHKTQDDRDEMRIRRLEWLSGFDEQNKAFYKYDREDAEDTGFMNNVSDRRTETLGNVLRLQLLNGHYSAREMKIFDYIIESLDERGFFVLPPSHLADVFGIPVSDAERYLKIMRSLDPAGICASGPAECLLIQIDRKEDPGWNVERTIIEMYMELLAKNKIPEIAGKLGQPVRRIMEALERIRELNPFPSQGFDTGDSMHYVIPDITILRQSDRFEILLNQDNYPEIRINKYYLRLLRSDCDKETKDYLNEKLRQIEETQEFIARRGSTLKALAEFLLESQQAFFLYGESRLRPMPMKEAASAIGVHESTVSRAVRDKYLQCSWGLFPLSYFFSSGISSGNEQVSTRTVKAALSAMIEGENTAKPYSDQKLSDLLHEKGFAVSRRTVAKYRKEMGIGNTRERKKWE